MMQIVVFSDELCIGIRGVEAEESGRYPLRDYVSYMKQLCNGGATF